jgi:hypothetical protein
MTTINCFTSNGVNLKSGYLSMTALQSPNGNYCGQGVIQDFIADHQEDDDHEYSDDSFGDEQAQDYSSDGQIIMVLMRMTMTSIQGMKSPVEPPTMRTMKTQMMRWKTAMQSLTACPLPQPA